MALISTAELAERIDEPDLVVCDVRFHLADHDQGRREYDKAHLPGARFVDLHTELAGGAGDDHGGGRHPLPSVVEFGGVLAKLGIGPGSSVVAYDSAGGAIAARLWWMLRSIGHGRVTVLDGGYQAWVTAGYAVTAEVPDVTETDYPVPAAWTGVVDADAVAQSIEHGGVVIDARSPERYRGDEELTDARAGHIPGAVNRFHGDTTGPDGLHLPTADLAQVFAGVGQNAIVYCGSGVTACHALMMMSTIGLPNGRLYPGSWSEWSADDTRPVATGNEP